MAASWRDCGITVVDLLQEVSYDFVIAAGDFIIIIDTFTTSHIFLR